MNVVIWARVSSREQREGYSIDAQLRADRDKAAREGWKVVREFEVCESAKRGAVRAAFNDMMKWIKANAKKDQVKAILSHKLDRVCRNMRDAVRLQELDDTCGVKLVFVENEFGPGPAGALSFNVMAAVAQYYSDNLRTEVLKGMDERVRQGWPTGGAPYGYHNVPEDRDEPVQPFPEQSKAVIRAFELYATGTYTFESLADKLAAEGHKYLPCYARFRRTALSYILNNRFYIGELRRNGQTYPGKHRPLVDLATFDACQQVLNCKNRRTGHPDLALSGGLFACAYCGQSITGERIRRKLKGGGFNEHIYYRCANNNPGPEHPKVRWRENDLEQAVFEDLSRIRLATSETAGWFRRSLEAAFADISTHQRQQTTSLTKRRSEIKTMQDRLLNAFLAGTVDEPDFRAKSEELKAETARVAASLDQVQNYDASRRDLALSVFDWCQNLGETWRGSNKVVRREILDLVCLNRTLGDVSLVATKRKPFDFFAERLDLENSRGERI